MGRKKLASGRVFPYFINIYKKLKILGADNRGKLCYTIASYNLLP